MHISGDFGTAGGGAPAGRDETIRRLLLSEDESDVWLALAELDQGYRKTICGWLLSCKRLNVQYADLGDIWEATTDSLVKMARENPDDFHKDGNLTNLLQTIAKWRAIDHYNKLRRGPYVGGVDGDVPDDNDGMDDAFDRFRGPDEMTMLIAAILEGIILLSELEQPVFAIRLKLWLQFERPPSIKELTFEFNRITGKSLTESTIKGRLQHGRPTLLEYLKSKGF